MRADTQAWTKDKPAGSHRIKAKWSENRYSWMQGDARPTLPGWKNMKVARQLRGMEEHEFCAAETDRIALSSLPDEGFLANEGPDLGEWSLQEEADWTRTEDEPSFEVSAAYEERQAMQEAIRQQRSPCKARLLQEVNDLMTAQAYEDPKAKEQKAVGKRKIKEMTKAGVELNVARFKERLKGASVADALAAIPCLLYTSPSPRDLSTSRMPSSA